MRVFDVNGDIKSDSLSSTITTSTTAGGDLTGTFPNPTVVATGLTVKVPSTFPDGVVIRNHADTAWAVAAGPPMGGTTPPTVTGSKVSGAALISLLAAGVSLGLIVDSTSA